MRLAIVSDIHANLPALEAVLEASGFEVIRSSYFDRPYGFGNRCLDIHPSEQARLNDSWHIAARVEIE